VEGNARRLLCLKERRDKRPCGARAETSRVEAGARAERRVGWLAPGRTPDRLRRA